jgi:hypothetical protein
LDSELSASAGIAIKLKCIQLHLSKYKRLDVGPLY